MKVRAKVPATSANMGPGFDTLGIALDLYNIIEVEEIDFGLEIECINAKGYVPKDERNLIYRAIKVVFDKVGYKARGLRIIQDSSIPMTRGLGSSSACIVGGMLCANVISGRRLSYKEILHLSAKMEGHPDNVAPAIYGGFCVSLMDEETTIAKSFSVNPQIKFALMIPEFSLSTRRSRSELPHKVLFSDAVYNISHAAILQAALISGDMSCIRYGVRDKLHQQYRKNNIEFMDEIFAETYKNGAFATYLSGSGPTILSVLDSKCKNFADCMKNYFNNNSILWDCKVVDVNNVGSVVCVID